MFFEWRQKAIAGVALAGLILIPSIEAAASGTPACNGHAEFCSRQYSNVSIIGAHDSYSVGSGIAANQNNDVSQQLEDGIRLLQVQGHMNNGELHLCHTNCNLQNGGTLTAYLQKVKSFLDQNPREVVTILMVNTDGLDPSVWAQSFEAAGLSGMAYAPQNKGVGVNNWPTLQELINQNKRVVAFLAQQANPSSVPYLIDEFSNVWETPFDETDSSFPCTVDRGTTDNTMGLMNHFLDTNSTIFGIQIQSPDKNALSQTNSYNSLMSQFNSCAQVGGRPPTFTLVDFYDHGKGDILQYAAHINGVSQLNTTVSSSGSNSTKGRTSSGNNSSSSSASLYSAVPFSFSWISLVVYGVLAFVFM